MSKLLFYTFITLCLGIALHSCYSPVEGCLDPESTNYGITADEPCEGCCDYPILQLSIYHESYDTTFTLEDTIINDIGQEIVIVDYAYLLSDFRIEYDDAGIGIADSIALDGSDGVIYTTDDVVVARRSQFTYDIGTIVFEGDVKRMSFLVGLNDDFNQFEISDQSLDHPLINDIDTLRQEDGSGFVSQRIQLTVGPDYLDTVIYDIKEPVSVSFPIDFDSEKGNNKKALMNARYAYWFEGIDFQTMSYTQITEKLRDNTTKLFEGR